MLSPQKLAQQILDALSKKRFLPFRLLKDNEVVVDDELVLANSVLSNLYVYFEHVDDVKIAIPTIEQVTIIDAPKLHITIQGQHKYEIIEK